MSFDSERLDPINWLILEQLQKDGRLSMAKLARFIDLSAPATTQRVHCLEDAGIIRGYRAIVDYRALGRKILAFARISGDGTGNIKDKERVRQLVSQMPEVLECHRGSGNERFILKLSAKTIEDLECITEPFALLGPVTTTIVLSSVLENGTIRECPIQGRSLR